ncbi:MAG: hypothetical protein OEQ53_18625 [Saprospiraceae bacterium]|nr:hypothetical protein [Saprospiraceae bacterium]
MYKVLTKHGQLIAFGTGVVVIVLFLGSVIGGLDGFNALSKDDQVTTSIFDLGLKATIALLVICAIIALLFGLYQMVTNPKGAIKGIIGLAVLVIVFVILYSMSVPETTGIVGQAAANFDVSEGQSKMISAALKSTLLLAGLAALTFVGSEIRNFFK